MQQKRARPEHEATERITKGTMSESIFDLNVFSNVASRDPDHNLAHHAIRSAEATFGTGLRARLFVDPNPNPDVFDAWVNHTRATLGRDIEVIATRGLADGFVRSVQTAQSAYAIQLEHDFVFLPEHIAHDLPTLTLGMAAMGQSYLKFNKRWNRALGYDYFMDGVPDAPFPCRRISGRSNNPQIIDTDFYARRVLPIIPADARKADGLEGLIDLHVGGGLVYGDLGHPATVAHLDGRRLRRKDAQRRKAYLRKAG
ncbi:MAG: hypothetical protein ACJAVR_004225 [Paracoccaceae bacterium]|jgi:hypothetical protein